MKTITARKTRAMVSRWINHRDMLQYFVMDFDTQPLYTFIWKDKRAMNRATATGADACFWGLHECGAIHLSAESIGAGIFAHELYHAARRYLESVEEEKSAEMMQVYTAKFWNWFYDHFQRQEGKQ